MRITHLLFVMIWVLSALAPRQSVPRELHPPYNVTTTGAGGENIADQYAPAAPDGNVIYVKKNATGSNNGSSWGNAYTNLQSALTAAVATDQIWVAQGVYTPTLMSLPPDPRSAAFALKNGVSLYGGFAGTESTRSARNWHTHRTILSGDLNGNDSGLYNLGDPSFSENSYHVITATAVDQSARLDGFIIQSGNANSEIGGSSMQEGGGIYVDSGSPSLVNLTLFNNNAILGGGQYNTDSHSTIINCAFIGNKADFGAGMRNFDNSSPILINTLFSGNQSRLKAGAIYNSSSQVTLINNTLANNIDDYNSNAILNDINSSLIVKNSIVWGGTGLTQIANETNSTSELQFTLIRNGCVGTCSGLILTQDPKFVDENGADNILGTLDDNLALSSTSPALDAGANSLVYADVLDVNENSNTSEPMPLDLAGNPRFGNSSAPDVGWGIAPIVDIGAYELPPYYLYGPVVIRK